MSTRFTRKGIPMVESRSLQLIQSAQRLNDVITLLECGVNYGSEIARNLDVTRQMVAKTVKQLCKLGYLEQIDGAGKQKEIHFTVTGECLISDARQLLSELDEILFKNTNTSKPQTIIDELNKMICAVNDRQHT